MTPDELARTYVYNNTEVKLTGRTADREPPARATARPTTRKAQTASTTLYEITPVDQLNGSWKKWVRMVELYVINKPYV
jgi:hypothetical protein